MRSWTMNHRIWFKEDQKNHYWRSRCHTKISNDESIDFITSGQKTIPLLIHVQANCLNQWLKCTMKTFDFIVMFNKGIVLNNDHVLNGNFDPLWSYALIFLCDFFDIRRINILCIDETSFAPAYRFCEFHIGLGCFPFCFWNIYFSIKRTNKRIHEVIIFLFKFFSVFFVK